MELKSSSPLERFLGVRAHRFRTRDRAQKEKEGVGSGLEGPGDAMLMPRTNSGNRWRKKWSLRVCTNQGAEIWVV